MSQHFNWCWNRIVAIIELFEEVFASRSGEHICVWHANHIYNQLHLFSFIGTWKQGKPCKQFNADAAKAPHIDLLCEWEESKHNVRCTVEATLNVGVHNFILKTATTEVSNCNAALVFVLQ